MLHWLRHDYFWRQLHLWSSLVIGIQLIAWFASGFVMSVLPIEEVRGQHLRKALPEVSWQQVHIAPKDVLSTFPANSSLTLSQRATEPVYLVTTSEHTHAISAISGQTLPTLTANEISALAKLQYQGDAELLTAELFELVPNEVRGLTAPVWRVNIADAEHSSLYLDANTGVLQRVRTDTWRLYDFFWMLHIMDYQNREDFNHLLLIICAGSAFIFSLSGMVLLLLVLRRKWRKRLVISAQ